MALLKSFKAVNIKNEWFNTFITGFLKNDSFDGRISEKQSNVVLKYLKCKETGVYSDIYEGYLNNYKIYISFETKGNRLIIKDMSSKKCYMLHDDKVKYSLRELIKEYSHLWDLRSCLESNLLRRVF